MSALLSLHYLPCIEYFVCFVKHDKIYLEACENYIKQSYRNRCLIKSSQKTEVLSVPVCKGNGSTRIRDVKIDYSQGWVKDHWRGIQAAYGKSPFFEHYEGLFYDIFQKKPSYLFEMNMELLTLCLKLLQISAPLALTEVYQKTPESGIKDYRDTIHPKVSYLKNDLLAPCTYTQVFGRNFAVNLSIIDLLFCEGPNARQILLQSSK